MIRDNIKTESKGEEFQKNSKYSWCLNNMGWTVGIRAYMDFFRWIRATVLQDGQLVESLYMKPPICRVNCEVMWIFRCVGAGTPNPCVVQESTGRACVCMYVCIYFGFQLILFFNWNVVDLWCWIGLGCTI